MASGQRIIAVVNNRGGVGKSTIAFHLAHVASLSRTTCLLDLTATPTRDAPKSSGKSASAALDLLSLGAGAPYAVLSAAIALAAALISPWSPTVAAVACSAAVAIIPFLRKKRLPLLWNEFGWAAGESLRIIGSDGTLPMSGFHWKRAASSFCAPASLTICDLDNVIDDSARFALRIATHVLIPTSFSEADAQRCLSDRRNGSVTEACCAHAAKARVLLLFNRCRVQSSATEGDQEFGISAADAAARDRIVGLLAPYLPRNLVVGLFRELSPSLRVKMEETPVTRLTGDAAQDAQMNLLRLLVKLEV